MQEVLLRSLPYLPNFDSPKALVVWLYKVAKNRCILSRRRSKFVPKQELSLEELMPDEGELERLRDGRISPETLAMRSEQSKWVRAAIQKLPPQYRIVLVLRDMENLSDEEVAEITGIKAGTVRVRLHRARLFVRKELAKPSSRRIESLSKVIRSHRSRNCRAMFAELSNYLDEELDDSMCSELEKHLSGCEPCKAFLDSLEESIRKCQAVPPDTPERRRAEASLRRLTSKYRSVISEKSGRG